MVAQNVTCSVRHQTYRLARFGITKHDSSVRKINFRSSQSDDFACSIKQALPASGSLAAVLRPPIKTT
jgi:hypothetical protein